MRKLRAQRPAAGYPQPCPRGRGPEVSWPRRSGDRLKPLDEAAAYARCHGDRDESVRIVHLPPRRKRYDDLLATGEEIRLRFEERIDGRESEEPP